MALTSAPGRQRSSTSFHNLAWLAFSPSLFPLMIAEDTSEPRRICARTTRPPRSRASELTLPGARGTRIAQRVSRRRKWKSKDEHSFVTRERGAMGGQAARSNGRVYQQRSPRAHVSPGGSNLPSEHRGRTRPRRALERACSEAERPRAGALFRRALARFRTLGGARRRVATA